MVDSLSEALKEAYAVAPSNLVIFHTLQIRQLTVQGSVYMVQSRRAITAFDENGVERTFEPVGFQFTLPPSNEEGFRSLNIAIDNVGQRITDWITTSLSEEVPVEAFYRPYLSTDLSVPQMNPPLVLYVKDIEITPFLVTIRATFMDVVNKKFPSRLYNRLQFPALG